MRNLKNKFEIKSLKWQILSRFLMILIILLVAMGIFQYMSMKEYLYRTKVQVLHERFHNIDMQTLSKENIINLCESNTFSEVTSKLWDKSMSIAIIDNAGNVLFERTNADRPSYDDNDNEKDKDKDDFKKIDNLKKPQQIEELPVPVLTKEEYLNICKEDGNLAMKYKIVKDENSNYQLVSWAKIGDLNSPSGLIQLSTSIDDITGALSKQQYAHTGISIIILIIGTILGIAIFNRTLKPLYNITNTVEGIGITDLDKRLKDENGQLEIDKLAKSFNVMLSRIEESFEKEQQIKEKMRRFVSDASHELRTPLTSIHGFVEVLLRGAAKNRDQLDLALNSILIESERLTKLVNDLLILTKLDQKPVVKMKSESINELIQEIEPQLKILCKNRSLQVDLKANEKAIINRDQIKQVIFNLTQNAVLHTNKDNGIINISTDIENIDSESLVVLKISDNGTGIPEKDIAKIYDRFFRSESHRSREQGGYGLGLSIVKAIVDSNEGRIEVESEINIGTTFIVYLRIKN